jgi:hypothetical protein
MENPMVYVWNKDKILIRNDIKELFDNSTLIDKNNNLYTIKWIHSEPDKFPPGLEITENLKVNIPVKYVSSENLIKIQNNYEHYGC